MFKNTSNKRAITVATLAAIFAMAGLARADDGGSEDYLVPAGFITEGDGGADIAHDIAHRRHCLRL